MFCGITKQTRQLWFNEGSEVSMDEIFQMLKASKIGKINSKETVFQHVCASSYWA